MRSPHPRIFLLVYGPELGERADERENDVGFVVLVEVSFAKFKLVLNQHILFEEGINRTLESTHHDLLIASVLSYLLPIQIFSTLGLFGFFRFN